MTTGIRQFVDIDTHRLTDPDYRDRCAKRLDAEGALVLRSFFTDVFVDSVRKESTGREPEAFFASSTHNIWLTPPDPNYAEDHAFNRQMVSTKGLLADDQVPSTSALRAVYDDPSVREFIASVVGVAEVYPYADDLSSVNVHFHRDGEELGWHFDNSSFAITTLITPPKDGGVFEYVPELRDAALDEQNFDGVRDAVDNATNVHQLDFEPGDLVIFRGRNSMHRVTPSQGDRTRILVVFAFNTEPGIGLSESAKQTFYGRT